MDGYEFRPVLLQQRPHRAVVLIGGLVLAGLALRTVHQVETWRSEQALWTHAAYVAPRTAKPLVNLAAEAMRARRSTDAWALLARAEVIARQEPMPTQAESLDVIAANRAVLLLRDGRLREAQALIHGWGLPTARGELCVSVPALC